MKVTRLLVVSAVLCLGTIAAQADMVTDWNDKAVAFAVSRDMGPPPAERIMAMTHLAMFDAVNSIERKYRPYLVQLTVTPTASKEAAAAAAAGTVLAGVDPRGPAEMKAALEAYLAAIPDSADKAEGIKLGEAVAAKFLEARANDGAKAAGHLSATDYAGRLCPHRSPRGAAVGRRQAFRPDQRVAVPAGAADRAQQRGMGRQLQRDQGYWGPQQLEALRTADRGRTFLAGGRRQKSITPLSPAIVEAKKPSIIDSARLFALAAVARADALIAVFDAKYQYEFWRPVTAIRNGDLDGNAATERDAAWQPVGPTPMHPEYPCAHCISSAGLAGVVQTVFGTAEMPEVSIESPTLPGVVHRWTDVRAFTDECSQARILAGFHYRFSVKVGQDMGYKIGEYVAKNVMQPVTAKAAAR